MTNHQGPSKANVGAPVVAIDPLVQRPARWVVQFYWVVASASLVVYLLYYCLFAAYRKPPVIELCFYPVFYVSGFLVKSFFWSKTPEMFLRLVQLGTLPGEALHEILARFQRRLDYRFGQLLGIGFGFMIMVFYFVAQSQWPVSEWSLGEWTVNLFIVAIDVLLGYTAGVIAWKLFITALEIRQLAEQNVLRLQPFHPDMCQGLSPIGSATLAISQILAVVGIFFAVFLFYYRWVSSDPPTIYLDYEPWFFLGLAITVVTTILAFVWPMFLIHRLMQVEAEHARWQLNDLASRISSMEQSLTQKSFEMQDTEIKEQEAKIVLLKRLYHQHDHVPTWPIDLPTSRKFFAAQIPLWLGTVSSAFGLWDRIRGE